MINHQQSLTASLRRGIASIPQAAGG